MGFMDKVVVGINRGVNSVGEGSKTFVEKAKLNTKIDDLQKEKQSYIHNMGGLVYNLMLSGEVSIPQCEGICNEIAACDREIEVVKQEIAMLDRQRITRQPEQFAAASYDMKDGIRCKCGFMNKSTAKFCASCGGPLNAQPAAAAAAENAVLKETEVPASEKEGEI